MTDLSTRIAAMREVVTDCENLVESLTAAAEESAPKAAERFLGWRVPVESLRNDINRQVQSLAGETERG